MPFKLRVPQNHRNDNGVGVIYFHIWIPFMAFIIYSVRKFTFISMYNMEMISID